MARYLDVARTLGDALERSQDDIEGKDLKKITLTLWFNEKTGEPRDTEVTCTRMHPPERESDRREREYAAEQRGHTSRLASARRVDATPQRLAAIELGKSS